MKKDKRVENIFMELQRNGLIDRKRKLKVARWGNLQAAKITNSIKYNPNFTKYLSENTIRFALLHEEGHKSKKQFSYIAVGFTVLFIILLIVDRNLDVFSKSIISFFWALTMVNLFNRLFRFDEFRADEYATKKIYIQYRISPSAIFKEFMEETDKINLNEPNWIQCIWSALFEYHPLEIERLERIRILEEFMKDETK